MLGGRGRGLAARCPYRLGAVRSEAERLGEESRRVIVGVETNPFAIGAGSEGTEGVVRGTDGFGGPS